MNENAADGEELPEDWLNHLAAMEAGGTPDTKEASQELIAAGKLLGDLRLLTQASIDPNSSALPFQQPQRIGGYVLGKMIGAGGCAVVYHSQNELLKRDAAIKIPLPHILLNDISRERFLQESRLAASLNHPHIVTVFEAGQDGTLPFIAYEYCPGPPLSTWVDENGPLAPLDAARMLAQLADAIEYSHRHKILHRDLKPSNVLLFPADGKPQSFPFHPKLTDFGFAKSLENANCLTQSSIFVGTPMYAAPEQFKSRHDSLTPMSDVYGLGVVLFQSLTGTTPCSGQSLMNVLDDIKTGRYERLSHRSDIPKDLGYICDRAMAFHPSDRYPTAAMMKADLVAFVEGRPIRRKRTNLLRACRQAICDRSRIPEASGFVLLSNAALLLWIIAWPVAIAFRIPFTAGTTIEELVPYTLPLAVMHVYFLFVGRRIGQQKKWAAATSTIMSIALAFFQFAVLARWLSPPYPTIYPDERTRDIVFLLLFSMFLMQALLSAMAWTAIAGEQRSRELSQG